MVDKYNYTYVTLLSTDSYLMGVLLLEQMLKKVGSKYPLLVLCAQGVSNMSFNILNTFSIEYLRLVEHISVEGVTQTDVNQEHWTYTFDKLYIWKLTDYDKIVYIDSDMQIVANIDDLFDYPHMSAVKADVFSNPHAKEFNSGLMVICPNMKEFNGMKDLWLSGKLPKSHVGDQDVINGFYANNAGGGRYLPFGYNVLYPDASRGLIKKEDVEPIRVIHYIGKLKPWMVSIRAIYRRSKNNFLGKYLWQYAILIYLTRLKFLVRCLVPRYY